MTRDTRIADIYPPRADRAYYETVILGAMPLWPRVPLSKLNQECDRMEQELARQADRLNAEAFVVDAHFDLPWDVANQR